MARRFSSCRPGRELDAFRLTTRVLKRWAQLEFEQVLAGRPGLSQLARPPLPYRVDLHGRRNGKLFFDRLEGKRAEDLYRASNLQGAGHLTADDQATAATLAIRLIEGATVGPVPRTLASALYMRDLRIRVTGAVWSLHDTLGHLPRSVFTLIPRGLSLREAELRAFDVRRVMRALRSALNRAGARDADGALIVFLHGEFDDNTGRFQLHFHGWAAGRMVAVVRRLRHQRAYKSTVSARAHDTDGVRNRVVVSSRLISDPAYATSYLTQSFWPHRPTGVLAETSKGKGGRFRVRGKRRIPAPQHSQLLVWLDQWRVEDISLLMKVSVVQGRLRLNNAQVAYTNGKQ